MSPAEIRQTEIDGVPVFWAPGPEPLAAGLCFGIGRRDESFALGGITHLVEHIVMGALPKSHLDRNAHVELDRTEFTASGKPDAVVAFLAQVCELLGDLPTDRLANEARVLAAEEARGGGDTHGQLLLIRYGATGVGLSGMLEPAIGTLTAEQVREHARTWFVRDNAALWLTGEPPAGLRLPLPSGQPPRVAGQRRIPHSYPVQYRYPGPDVAVSFEVARTPLGLPALRILSDRLMERLRHVGGHSYEVDFVTTPVDRDTVHVAFFADAAPNEVASVVTGMHAELTRFVAEGPTEDEIADDLAGFEEHVDDPRSVEGLLDASIGRHFMGIPVEQVHERLTKLRAATPASLQQALAPALQTLLVLVPDEAPPLLQQVPELPEGTRDPLTGREWRRRFRADVPRGSRLISSAEGVSLVMPGMELTIRYADCVSRGTSDDEHAHLELVGHHGMTITLCEQDWKDGAELCAEVLAATRDVPTYRVLDDPDH